MMNSVADLLAPEASTAGGRVDTLAGRVGRLVSTCTLAASLGMAAITGFVAWMQYDELAQRRVERMADQARHRLEVEVAAPLADAVSLANSAVAVDALMGQEPHPVHLANLLAEFARRKPRLRAISMHDAAGRPRSGDGPADPLARLAARSGSFRYEWVGNGLLRVACPVVLPRTGSTEGAFLLEIDAGAALAQFREGSAVPNGYRIALQGISDSRTLWATDGTSRSERLHRTVTRSFEVEGWGPMATISVGIAGDAFWAPVRRLAALAGALLLLVAVVVLALSRFASRRLVRPIEELIGEVDRLARHPATGSQRLGRNDRIGELNTLAKAVERMLDAVAGYRARLTAQLDREQAHRRLSLVERALRVSPSGAFIGAVQGSKVRLIYWNAAFQKLVETEEPIAGPFGYEHIPCADAHSIAALRRAMEAARAGREGSTVLRLASRTGGVKWCQLSIRAMPRREGGGQYCVGTLEDITERHEAQSQLAEWAQRVDAVFSMSPDGFACFNAQGRLVALNPAMSEILGVGRYEPLGWSEARFAQLIVDRVNPEEGLGPDLLELTDGSSEAGASTPGAGRAVTRWPRQIEFTGPPRRVLRMQVRQYHGSVAGKVVYLHDVTREFDLDRLKSEFLSTAAHELRTPMASLLGYAELLRDRKLSPETKGEVFGIIYKQAERLGRLLDDLLDLARIEARGERLFRFRVCPVQDIVHEAIDAMAAEGSGHEVDATLPAEPLWVRADPEKLLQALLNVLSNAYKYSPPNGPVRLKVSVDASDGIPAEMSILVADEGMGMRPEDAERAFERFFRADSAARVPGTGPGLPLVKEIVEAHGGCVSLRSALGRGTEVTIRLPLVQPEAPAVDRDDAAARGALPDTTDPATTFATGERS